ncbi:hypothetical protein AQUCO_03600058v1 [Aquilegia coerulea]|uniref:Uncharacterized protein n=1 Tax=Aquilegia coerulea TaxID=218851 RepID=A0A2G5CVA5_AQUCA|nr:hypothetical protein AQUCO_03600058v1 [Aquilegia coerulea]
MASSSLNLLPAIFFTIVILSNLTLVISQIEKSHSICQVQDMKLKITHLEAILEQSIQSSELKFRNLREKEKMISEMANKIDLLHTILANIKVDTTYTEERISALEEEVRLLWAASRKNNFDIHVLESKAQRADGKIQAVTTKVQKMEGIVTEQWIQIQQLDQALIITERRILEAQRRATSSRCTYMKLIQGICGHYLPKYSGVLEHHLCSKDSVLHSCVSHVFNQWKKTTTAVRKHHHEVSQHSNFSST